MAAGGVTGTGLGLANHVTGNIPELTSDMIFAAVGEELGFLGIIVIICLFASFVGEGFHIAQRSTSDYVRLAAAGLAATMGFQAFVIMAGILRILPFTGITLPFVAYGGEFPRRQLRRRGAAASHLRRERPRSSRWRNCRGEIQTTPSRQRRDGSATLSG